VTPLVALALDRARFGRLVAGVSSPSPHLFLSAAGVSRKSPSPSPSSSRFKVATRFVKAEPWSSFLLDKGGAVGGEGVDIGAEDGAVVCDEAEGTRSALAGVEKSEVREPSDRSGWVPADCEDVSRCVFKASDMSS